MANDMIRRNHDMMIDPMFEQMGRRLFGEMAPGRTLKTDIKETEKDYQVTVDVPGIKKEDVQIAYHHGVLDIRVERHSIDDHTDKDGNLLMSERNYGEMARRFRLPDVDRSGVTAKMEAGELKLVLPKLPEGHTPMEDRIAIE